MSARPTISVQLLIDETALEAIAAYSAEIVCARLADEHSPASPWLTGAAAAADYLGWSVQRLYKHARKLPHYRHGSLLMFRMDELDAFIEQGYEGPPRPVDFGASGRSRPDAAAPVPFQADGRAHG